MDALYIASLTACLVQLYRTGYARRLPLFAVATVAALAFEMAYQPYSLPWLKDWFAAPLTPLLAARALAVGEAFVVSSAGFRQRRTIAAAAVFLALLFAAVVAWRFASADVLHSAIQARRVVVVGLAAFLGVYILLMWSIGYRRSGVLDFHVLLMFLLCSVMGCAAVLRMAHPGGIWEAANNASYAACALVYFTWAVAFEPRWIPPSPPRPGFQTLAG